MTRRPARHHAARSSRAPRLRDAARFDETDAWELEYERAPRGRTRRRRRRSIWGTLKLIVALVFVGLVVGAVLLGVRAAAFNDRVSTAPFLSTALLGPLNGSDRVNVLLVGYGGGQHDGAYLADSISILSIDPQTDTTTTIPVPRDLWIEGVSSFPQNGKVNEAFAVGEQSGGIEGAGELLAAVLGEITGLAIDHWLAIDFAGFQEMVDAVGGVTIQNPTAFSYTMNEQLHRSQAWNDGSFAAGAIRLDGAQALAYARARYTNVPSESTDFARSVRQARIIGGLRSGVGEGGIGAIGPGIGLMNAMEDRLQTDVSAIDLFLLSGHLGSDRRVELAEDVVLTATTNTIGQYILVPVGWTGPGAYGPIHSYLAAELARPVETPAPTVAP